MTTVQLELSPMSRETGVVYLDSVYLDDGELEVDDAVRLLDEGGQAWSAVVVDKRPARYGGHKYRLLLQR